MNRFEYTDPSLSTNETLITRENNVRLYDGEQKSPFQGGEIIITTHRIIWGNPNDFNLGNIILSLPLKLVKYIQEDSPGAFSFSKSKRIVLYLQEPLPDRNEGPQITSLYNYVKLSFREGYSKELMKVLNECLEKRKWEEVIKSQQRNIALRTGIAGIEKSIQDKHKQNDKNISAAFQDLSKLMVMAKDMVRLSNNISTKIREKQGDITEDETIRFKSYLMSLGIDDPVTRDGYKCDSEYYKSLARQISNIISEPIADVGGMMALTDVYCRVNRARGLELLSPEDLLNACKFMDNLGLPVHMYQFDTGVKVLRLITLDNSNVSNTTAELLEDKGSLTAEELARLLNISVMLAKERLLITEGMGKCCRDDSIEGLRFYPNYFLTRD